MTNKRALSHKLYRSKVFILADFEDPNLTCPIWEINNNYYTLIHIFLVQLIVNLNGRRTFPDCAQPGQWHSSLSEWWEGKAWENDGEDCPLFSLSLSIVYKMYALCYPPPPTDNRGALILNNAVWDMVISAVYPRGFHYCSASGHVFETSWEVRKWHCQLRIPIVSYQITNKILASSGQQHEAWSLGNVLSRLLTIMYLFKSY